MPIKRRDVMDRLMARRAVNENGCWIAASKSDNGHGYRYISDEHRRKIYVHRLAYARLVGPLVEGMEIDHLCRNRACFNPSHLRQVTSRENLMASDGPSSRNAKKTVCKRGHALVGENVGVRKNGNRFCRTCSRALDQKRNSTDARKAYDRSRKRSRIVARVGQQLDEEWRAKQEQKETRKS